MESDVEVLGRHQLADDGVKRPEELVEARGLVCRFGNPVGRLLELFGARSLRDVPEAPDPSSGASLHQLRLREALEDPAVAECEDVDALGFGGRIEFPYLAEKGFGVRELLGDESERLLVLVCLQHLHGNPPHLGKPLVVGDDAPVQVHDQDAVRCGLERRLQERQRLPSIEGLKLQLVQVLGVCDGERDRVCDCPIGLEVRGARFPFLEEQEIEGAEGLLAEHEWNREAGDESSRGEGQTNRREDPLVVREIR